MIDPDTNLPPGTLLQDIDPEDRAPQFSRGPQAKFTITPLGAAYVEALPDRAKAKAIQAAFKHDKVCPVSKCFPTPESVEGFYTERGQKVRAV